MPKVLTGRFYKANAGAFAGITAGCVAMALAATVGSTVFTGGISDSKGSIEPVYIIE